MRRITLKHFAIFMSTFWLMGMALQSSSLAADKEGLNERLETSKAVFQELLTSKDNEVPEALMKNAKCIAVIPHVIKGAIGYGARHGKGVMTCKSGDGHWSPPAFVSITGGSVGLQIGVESTDLVLFFMSEKGAQSLIKGSKVTLGGKLSIAAGPAGRSGEAATDLALNAEIYSYAKSKGLFAGISLEGARLAPDKKAIVEYYGPSVTAKQLLFDHKAPETQPAVNDFLSVLP